MGARGLNVLHLLPAFKSLFMLRNTFASAAAGTIFTPWRANVGFTFFEDQVLLKLPYYYHD